MGALPYTGAPYCLKENSINPYYIMKNMKIEHLLKSTALSLAVFALPMAANAQEWSWECEAEEASEIVYGKISDATAEGNLVSGGQYVEELSTAKGSHLGFMVSDVPAAGMYDLSISYISMQERFLLIQVADREPIVVDCDEITGGWNGVPATETNEETGEEIDRPGVATKTIPVYIPYSGDVDLYIYAFEGYSQSTGGNICFAPNIDKIALTPSDAELVETPAEMTPIEIEAEDFTSASGTAGVMTEKYEAYPSQAGMTLRGAGRATYLINAPEAGSYALYLDYTTCQTRWIYIKVNSQVKQYLEFSEKTQTWGDVPETPDETKPLVYRKATLIYLEAGENTLILNSYNGPTSEHGDSPNFDKLTIRKVQADMEIPATEVIAYPFDYTSLATLSSSAGEMMPEFTDKNEHTSATLNVNSATFDAKMPYPIMLTGYAIASSNNMENWKVKASADGNEWVDLTSTIASTEGNFELRNVEFSQESPLAYQYFRLEATADENINLAEWQLFGSPYISAERALPDDLFMGNGYLTASENGWNANEDFGEKYQYVIDGLLSTKFTTDQVKSPTEKNPIWLQYELEDMALAQSYSLTVPWSYTDRNPKDWTLYGYSVDEDNWVVLDQRQGMDFATPSSTLVFNIANPVNCYGFKLEITANNGSHDNTHLTAWQVFAEKQNLPDAIEENRIDNSVNAFGTTGLIHLSSTEVAPYQIYNLSGVCLAQGEVKEAVEIQASAGVYIVLIDNQAKKVLVK